MVEMTNFNVNFGLTAQSRTMVSILQECENKLVQMMHDPVVVERRTITTTITRTEVVEAMISLQHAPNPMAAKFDDIYDHNTIHSSGNLSITFNT